ncbi:MAG TPA: hypothetical protein VFB19_01800 [Mycobacterium sp.]|nr:hypothetical protein [Mycobacterium sp.]
MTPARTVVAAAFAGAVVLCGAACASSPPGPSNNTVFVIGKCFDPTQPPQERPARFAYNCDQTGVVQDITWTSWGAAGANGTGTDNSVDCQPNCAQGHHLVNPVAVHAWNPKPPTNSACPKGVQFYSDLTIAYPNGAPPWIKPGTTWTSGTDFVTVDGKPAVHFSGLLPNCEPR